MLIATQNSLLILVYKTMDSLPSRRYNKIAVDSFQQEGGDIMHYIDSFLISVMAGIVCYYISKWLDRKK